MGAVYRCVDERLGREVAVKQVGRMPGESVTDQARALREARSSAALNHPNVVAAYDAVAEGDHVWLVMEYVPGRTLAQILREDGPLPPLRAARIGAQVADGLAAAHRRGTVHRDVKPGNVLVAEGDRAKISDFGIARTAGDPSLTQSGILTGTPAYFAPEVARGGDPGPASDVWALGATVFAAVEGHPPYDDNPNSLALLATIASEEPPTPAHAGPLAGPIGRMLDRDPGSRWSMVDVAHALHRIHEQAPADDTREETRALAAPVPAESPPAPAAPERREPTPVPAAGTSRRRGGRVALLVAGLVALLAVAIGALVLLGDEPGGAPAADEETTDAPTRDDSPAEPESSATNGSPSVEQGGANAGGGGRVAFVEDYYAALPDDTEDGYSRLAPSYRDDLSYEDYEGFWSTVGEVTVQDSSPAGPDAVDVTLDYDGEQEVRRIYLVRGDDGWLIRGDEVVG
jgi:hypothetical protein